MSSEPDTPGAELRVALAGPAVTLALCVIAGGIAMAIVGADAFTSVAALSSDAHASPAEVVVSLMFSMNLLLLVFNLVPAFPLDGGRVARAAAWKATGDRVRATRMAARVGITFGWILMAGGALLLVTGAGDALDGIWIAALGWMLAGSARATLAQAAFSERLQGV